MCAKVEVCLQFSQQAMGKTYDSIFKTPKVSIVVVLSPLTAIIEEQV